MNIRRISRGSVSEFSFCERIRNIVTEKASDVVINTAVYYKIDECEENVEKTFEVDTYAVRNLA